MPKKDNDELRLDDGQLSTAEDDQRSDGSELPSGDGTPDWLRAEENASSDIDALIAEAEASMDLAAEQNSAAFDELAQWSSGYDGNPERELAGLTRLREHLKQLPKSQLKPGQFAAVKSRIALLNKLIATRKG